ncbi:hypothetical protein AB0M39_31345 [Streptomyces sp. NPDC051907]|uniref:hypothetical protein n=1 Tax=Streptomyces sp. NPDC051907 TaxID=3155284 RepID=UPI003445453E
MVIGRSDSEQWTAKLKDSSGLVENAKKAVAAVSKHCEAIRSLVGPGREMTADEREDWQDELEKVQPHPAEAGKYLRELRYWPTDTGAKASGIGDFTFGTEQGE